ncbi:MAG: ABC transporter substrate-binding protein [Negativicutes bacterium]
MKRTLAIFLVMATLFLLTACSKTNAPAASTTSATNATAKSQIKRGGTLTIAKTTNITSLDPSKTSSIDNDGTVLAQIFESLLEQDAKGNLIPGLAESYEVSADTLAITFKLRKDVTFHDGTKFNAAAAKACLDRYLSKESAHVNYTSELTAIKSVDAVDDYAIRLNLSTPDATLPTSMSGVSGWMISPESIKKGIVATKPAGTGAFKVSEYVEGDHATFVPYEGYYLKGEDGKPLPYLDKLVIRFITDDNVKATNLQSGDIDGVDYHSSTNSLKKAQADKNLNSYSVPAASNYFVSFNLNDTVLDNLKLRQAIAYAVNRQELIDVVLEGYGTIAPFVVQKSQWYYSDYNPYSYDLNKAKSLLAEAGYPNGLTLKMYYISREPDNTMVQLLQQQLKKVGITMQLEGMDRLAWIDLVRTKRSGALGFGVLANFGFEASRQYTSTLYYLAPTKVTGISDILAKTKKIFDKNERLKLLNEFQKSYLDNCYHLFVAQAPRYTSYNKKVQNLSHYWFTAAKYNQVWLDK